MRDGKIQHQSLRGQPARFAVLVILGLIFPIREIPASPLAPNESSQQATAQESPTAKECQISDATREALENAWAVELQMQEIPKFLELYNQAQAAAKPPECDSVKARILADKARQLAEECPTDESALSAIDAATAASNEKGRPIDVEDLIYQAKVALSPPECNAFRARNLADKAKQLTYRSKPSIWHNETFWILLAMLIHL